MMSWLLRTITNSARSHPVLLALAFCVGSTVVLVLMGKIAPHLLVPVVVGSWLAGYGAMGLRRAALALRWERVVATVVFRGIQQVWDYDARYRPMVRFDAVVDGRRKQYERFSLNAEDFEGDERDAEEILRQYAVGGEILVFRDPAAAGGLLVRVDLPARRRQHYRMCVVAGCGLIAVAVAVATMAP